jgi:hypothetical protein
LSGILNKLEEGRPLTKNAFGYLQKHGLSALERLARSEITYENFREIAAREKVEREQKIEAERQAQIASLNALEAEHREKLEAARLARESDPKYIAKMKNRALRARYSVDVFIEPEHFSRVMEILRRFDTGERLTDNDVLWLTTEGRDYYSEELQIAFHKREAEFFSSEYRITKDPWNAVNASGHYRKCNEAEAAHELLCSIPDVRELPPKLRSAIATTHGGVMRDLNRLDKALALGSRAHKMMLKDFRPCTLLGAVNFELGEYDTGRAWYAEAVRLGASERSVDADLKGIIRRANPAKREEIKAVLLSQDPDRYHWVTKMPR